MKRESEKEGEREGKKWRPRASFLFCFLAPLVFINEYFMARHFSFVQPSLINIISLALIYLFLYLLKQRNVFLFSCSFFLPSS